MEHTTPIIIFIYCTLCGFLECKEEHEDQVCSCCGAGLLDDHQ
ncbi:hypothetical protein [Metabacillus endolithicus]|uniref:YhfH family protein n=1 Tax=Metabacillus endolithicus TaxID=1535204 RepID=A0ABW5C293_9BACI